MKRGTTRGANGSAEKQWPMRWDMETHQSAEAASSEEGLSLAEWVRQVVKRALRRRKPKQEVGT